MSDLEISITFLKNTQLHVPVEKEKYTGVNGQLLNLENIYFKIQIIATW